MKELDQMGLHIKVGNLGSALFSTDKQMRYLLIRGEGAPHVLWILLNPSTADQDADDPTIRRVRAYSAAWFGAEQPVGIANLYPFRATDPKAMKAARARGVITPEVTDFNLRVIETWAAMAKHVVVAWGAHAIPADADKLHARLAAKEIALQRLDVPLTENNQPRHPLYLRRDVTLTPWHPTAKKD